MLFRSIPAWAQQWKPEWGVWMAGWLRYQIFAPIFLLHCVNLFWYYYILRIAWRAISSAPITDDRSDDEDDGDHQGKGD